MSTISSVKRRHYKRNKNRMKLITGNERPVLPVRTKYLSGPSNPESRAINFNKEEIRKADECYCHIKKRCALSSISFALSRRHCALVERRKEDKEEKGRMGEKKKNKFE